MTQQAMQFLYGDRELLLSVQDMFSAPVEVIVNPANEQLQHMDGLALQIIEQGGDQLQRESEQLIQEYGQIDTGMAVFTSAGNLPFKAVIHAVVPNIVEDEEQHIIQQAILRALQLCEVNEWVSIAFPAISSAQNKLPIEVCARAFFHTITHFWDARQECALNKIILCLTEDNFRVFFDAFRDDAVATEDQDPVEYEPAEEKIGYIEIDETELLDTDDDEVDDWFK
jgi:putative ATPase